jgi:hypothetical protein
MRRPLLIYPYILIKGSLCCRFIISRLHRSSPFIHSKFLLSLVDFPFKHRHLGATTSGPATGHHSISHHHHTPFHLFFPLVRSLIPIFHFHVFVPNLCLHTHTRSSLRFPSLFASFSVHLARTASFAVRQLFNLAQPILTNESGSTIGLNKSHQLDSLLV